MEKDQYLKNLKDVLALNRNKMPEPLSFQIPIHSLVDPDYCSQVSNLLNSGPSKWQILRVTPTVGRMLPEKSGLYMFCWEPELRFAMEQERRSFYWCLYVGKAHETTLRSRFEGEYKKLVMGDPNQLYGKNDNMKREELLKKYFCLQPLNIWYLPIVDKERIPDLEDKLIDLLNPPLNTQKSFRARLLQPQAAF